VAAAEGPAPEAAADLDSQSPAAASWYRRPWFFAGSAALLAALVLAPVARRLRRRSESRKQLSERLRHASTIPHGRRAAEALETAWRDFLEDRFEVPAKTALELWPGELRAAGLAPARAAEFGRLVEDIEYLRSAPELAASEALIADLAARSLKLARTLR
jgi:hypothetical protein